MLLVFIVDNKLDFGAPKVATMEHRGVGLELQKRGLKTD